MQGHHGHRPAHRSTPAAEVHPICAGQVPPQNRVPVAGAARLDQPNPLPPLSPAGGQTVTLCRSLDKGECPGHWACRRRGAEGWGFLFPSTHRSLTFCPAQPPLCPDQPTLSAPKRWAVEVWGRTARLFGHADGTCVVLLFECVRPRRAPLRAY